MQGRLWNEIADAMRAAEYDLSVMQCKTKWTNLVGTFNRVLNDKSLDLNAKKERFSCFNLVFNIT